MPINISSLLNLSVGNNITLRDLFSAGLILLVCLLVIRALMKLTRRLLANTKLATRLQK